MGDYKYTSKERARMPAGTEAILNARSLTTAHLHLASLLQSGFRVLDVGCGTGSITAGIAQAVAPEGHAIGIDINIIRDALGHSSLATTDRYLRAVAPVHVIDTMRSREWKI